MKEKIKKYLDINNWILYVLSKYRWWYNTTTSIIYIANITYWNKDLCYCSFVQGGSIPKVGVDFNPILIFQILVYTIYVIVA